ncbi:MAG: hypothetical protein EZS28_053850, partial [Streblomastix strix]
KFDSVIRYLEKEQAALIGQIARIETIIFWKGKFQQPALTLVQTHADTINVAGSGIDQTLIQAQPNIQNVLMQAGEGQSIVVERMHLSLSRTSPLAGFVSIKGENAGLAMFDMKLEGYTEIDDHATVLEPGTLFDVTGFVYAEDIIAQNINLVRGSFLSGTGLRRADDKEDMEWLGMRQSGLYRCLFDNFTTNETGLISLYDSVEPMANAQSNSKDNNKLKKQKNVPPYSFTFQEVIFSASVTSLKLDG